MGTTKDLLDILTQKNTYLIPGNIKKDVTILGVTGTYTSDATATASDIVLVEESSHRRSCVSS